MTDGVREGFSAVRALGLTVTPLALRVLFTWLPKSFAISYWRNFFRAEMADYVFGRHARAASGEMRTIANDCRAILAKTGMARLMPMRNEGGCGHNDCRPKSAAPPPGITGSYDFTLQMHVTKL
jgi:hypothetical protein